MKLKEKAVVMTAEDMERALRRMGNEIVERNHGAGDLVIIGIQRRGVYLAGRLREFLRTSEGVKLPLGELDITLYRDDITLLSDQPVVHSTSIPVDINGRRIVLVDDVLYTGRTIRAALEAIGDIGRPACVQLLILIDRGHRELPIQADYTPFWMMTSAHHGAEIAVALCVLWWVFAKGGLLRFSSLWRAILLFTATGLFFLPVIGSAWAGWALVLISIAQTLVVMLFWTMLADVAHHSRTSPYVIFGSGWIAYSLPFALGELAGKAEGLHGAGSAVLLALAYLLTIAAVFALNEANFSQRRIFADLEGPAPERSMFASIDEGCERLGSQRGLTAREVEVLQLLCKGRSKSYIAESLFISENTVRSHSKHIYAKLDVHSKQDILDLIARG